MEEGNSILFFEKINFHFAVEINTHETLPLSTEK